MVQQLKYFVFWSFLQFELPRPLRFLKQIATANSRQEKDRFKCINSAKTEQKNAKRLQTFEKDKPNKLFL